MAHTGSIISWIFGMVFLATGIINTFWGNDTGSGIFIVLLSLLIIPLSSNIIQRWLGRPISPFVRVVIGLFILWSSLGVGELFDKIDLMVNDLRHIRK